MLGDPLPHEVEILPSLERLKERCTVAGGSGGIATSAPLPGDESFLDHIADVHSAGFITTGEALEREALHELIIGASKASA